MGRKSKKTFNDEEIVAVTGGADPYDMPFRWIGVAIFHSYILAAGLIAGTRLLWGANCAVRRSSWTAIKDKVLMRPDIWEDYDMAMCLTESGRIKYVPKLIAKVSFRAVHTSFSKYAEYQFRSVRTFYLRTNLIRTVLFTVLWTTTFIAYPFAVFDDLVQKFFEKQKLDKSS